MEDYKKIESENIVLSEADDLSFGEGWYPWEHHDILAFRWMSKEAKFSISIEKLRKYKYLSFVAFSEFNDCSQYLSANIMGKAIASFALLPQWNHYSLVLPAYLENSTHR